MPTAGSLPGPLLVTATFYFLAIDNTSGVLVRNILLLFDTIAQPCTTTTQVLRH